MFGILAMRRKLCLDCARESNKKCSIYKYLNDCICMKSVFDNLVVICKDDMVNIPTNS